MPRQMTEAQKQKMKEGRARAQQAQASGSQPAVPTVKVQAPKASKKPVAKIRLPKTAVADVPNVINAALSELAKQGVTGTKVSGTIRLY